MFAKAVLTLVVVMFIASIVLGVIVGETKKTSAGLPHVIGTKYEAPAKITPLRARKKVLYHRNQNGEAEVRER